MDQNLLLGQALGLVTAICFAQNSIIYRHLGQKVGSQGVAHIRMWLALPFVLLLTRLIEGSWLPTDWALSTYLILLASGVIGYFLTDLLMFRAYILLGSRESMVIMTLSPVVTAALSLLLFDEYLNLIQLLGMVITIGGVGMMILLDRHPSPIACERKNRSTGVLYAVLGSILQSISFLLAKAALGEGGPVSTNLIRNIGGLGAFIIFNGLIKGNAKEHFKILRQPRALFLLLLASLAGPVLGMSSQMKAFTLAPVGVVTTITQVSPVLLLPFDWFILKRRISAASLAGTLLSIAGIAILFLSA
ncbi:MAG: DMT family transporter [Sphaerochaeta sp.]|jgi:drug/metabolite transporter (DMT)-like permease|nr:DMT family transporter [Sphaerochaeta sp.]MDX9915375.1 DMT family transporter [Sphaerochaeta sp.]